MTEQPSDEPVDTETAWRDIVDNYGDRAVVEPGEYVDEPRVVHARDEPAELDEPAEAAGVDDLWSDDDDEDEGYVPPPPPPLPVVAPARMAAWICVLGAPAVVVVLLIASIQLPTIVGWVLIAAFVGGFGYLVATMSREPRDPWDDGSRI